MPGGSSQTSGVEIAGNAGARLYDVTHTDIDESTVDVGIDAGSTDVTLNEAIWWEWKERRRWTPSGPGGRVNETIEVDSDWYDGDHNLVVIATANGTRGRVNFSSKDR